MPSILPSPCRIVFLCLIMTATMAATAAESAQKWNLAIGDGTVDVFDGRGCLVQSLPFDGESPDDDNRGYFAVVEDMDFDGVPDVRILYSQGMVNIYYDCWLWRPGAGAFIRRDDMRDLSNPGFNPAARSVSFYERGSATTYVVGELGWENGELVWLAKTETDESDDGDYLVVRRSLRDYAGELRLVAETTLMPEELEDCEYAGMDDSYYRPDLPGLNLFLDYPADFLDVAVLMNGEWWLRRNDPESGMLLELRRLPALEYGDAAADRLVRTEWPLAREIEIAPFPELSRKLGYPALKAFFLHGENGNARRLAAALVFADQWSFWFVLDAPAGNAENSISLKKRMEDLLLGIEKADPSNGDFLPAFGLPIYLAEAGSPLDISVMDAIIGIKKAFSPENSSGSDSGRVAYRYDGPVTVAGKAALRISFGADSWTKFAAERSFAVDEKGTVREIDVRFGEPTAP